jgi:uncharacterized repeat protein (TIGR02543 family)
MNKRLFVLVAAIVIGGIVVLGCDTGTNDSPTQYTQYTVTFNTDGGSTAPDPVKVDEGRSVEKLPEAPTKVGFVFRGWFTEKYGNGSEFTSNTVIGKDLIVYAKWDGRGIIGEWATTEGDTLTFTIDTVTFYSDLFDTSEYTSGWVNTFTGSYNFIGDEKIKIPGIYGEPGNPDHEVYCEFEFTLSDDGNTLSIDMFLRGEPQQFLRNSN